MQKRIVLLIIVGLAVIGLFLAWRLRVFDTFVLTTIDYVVDQFVHASGISRNLAKFCVILATIPFFISVSHFKWDLLLHGGLVPSLKLFRSGHGLVIVVYFALYSGTMYLAQIDNLNNKYCADTPEGIKVFDERMVDPVYGIQAEQCSRAQIMVIRSPKIAIPHRLKIGDPWHYAFMDPRTNQPRVWYYQWENGDIDFFDRPGYHPQMGEPLRPVDREFVKGFLSRAARERDERKRPRAALPADPVRHDVENVGRMSGDEPESNKGEIVADASEGSENTPPREAADGPFRVLLTRCHRSGDGPVECAFRVENRSAGVEAILMNPIYSQGGRVSSFSDPDGTHYMAMTPGARALSRASNVDVSPGSPREYEMVFPKVPRAISHGTIVLAADQGFRGRQLNFVFQDVSVGE